MNPNTRKMNILYGLVQVAYWSGFCMAFIYAAVFLQDKGYSNTHLGFIMAAGNIIGLFLAPVLAALVDKAKRSGIFVYIGLLLAAELLLVLSFFGAKQGLYLSVAYSIHMGCILSVTPLNTQLCFVLESWCGKLNFGATRGAGSLAFALVSTFMGSIVFRFGTVSLLYGQLLVISLQAALLICIYLLDKGHSGGSLFVQEKESGSSLIGFFRDNPRFSVMLLGVSMLFFAHNLLCNFFINVVSNLGGSTADMGTVSGIMAFCELPPMLFYSLLSKKFSCNSMLRFSILMFIFKSFAVAFAGSIPALTAACTLQMISFALLTPASVEYVNRYIPAKDAAKGQSLFFSTTSLGAIFATSLGGMMYDGMSVFSTLLSGAFVCTAGALICMFCIERRKRA